MQLPGALLPDAPFMDTRRENKAGSVIISVVLGKRTPADVQLTKGRPQLGG